MEFWFLSPGYKSVTINYAKTWRLISGLPPELMPFFHTTEIYSDLDGELAIVEMQCIRNDPELLKTELTLGLLNLKKVVEGSAFTILSEFMDNEYKSIPELQSNENKLEQ